VQLEATCGLLRGGWLLGLYLPAPFSGRSLSRSLTPGT
jgi:hypothetical protein